MVNVPGFIGRHKILLLSVAAVLGIFLLLAVLAGLYLCNFLYTFDNPDIVRSPYYEYIVKVRGIEGFDAPGGNASIYFPVPSYGGSPVLPFSDRLEKDTGIYAQGYSPYDCTIVNINPWGYHGTRSLEAVNTSHGWMLEARIRDTDYREVDFNRVPKPVTSFDKMEIRIQYPIGPSDSKKTNVTLEGLKAIPLFPHAGELPTNYTRPLADKNVTSYTSYIYLDEGLRPLDSNSTLGIYASLVIKVGDRPYGGGTSENYLFMINESIPGGVTGLIPVKVQYMGELGSLELYRYMESFYGK